MIRLTKPAATKFVYSGITMLSFAFFGFVSLLQKSLDAENKKILILLVVLVLVGMLAVFPYVHWLWQLVYLKRNGLKITGRVLDFKEIDASKTSWPVSQHQLVVSASGPTGEETIFTSEPFLFWNQPHVRQQLLERFPTALVYIERQAPYRYLVDLSRLKKEVLI